jgi:hypothetical protein
MLKNLRDEIRQCLQLADDCARKAAAESDPKIKADFLERSSQSADLCRRFNAAHPLTLGSR